LSIESGDLDGTAADVKAAAKAQRLAAARLGPRVELRIVRLTRLDYESPVPVVEPNTEVSLEIEVGAILPDEAKDRDDSKLEGSQMLPYRLKADLSCASEAGTAIRAEIWFDLVYEVLAGDPPTQEEIDAFGSVSAAFAGFPYLRELVQSLTVRSELPPLTLGVMRSPLDR